MFVLHRLHRLVPGEHFVLCPGDVFFLVNFGLEEAELELEFAPPPLPREDALPGDHGLFPNLGNVGLYVTQIDCELEIYCKVTYSLGTHFPPGGLGRALVPSGTCYTVFDRQRIPNLPPDFDAVPCPLRVRISPPDESWHRELDVPAPSCVRGPGPLWNV